MTEEKPAMSKEDCDKKNMSHIKPFDYKTKKGKEVHRKGTCRKKHNKKKE